MGYFCKSISNGNELFFRKKTIMVTNNFYEVTLSILNITKYDYHFCLNVSIRRHTNDANSMSIFKLSPVLLHINVKHFGIVYWEIFVKNHSNRNHGYNKVLFLYCTMIIFILSTVWNKIVVSAVMNRTDH